MATQTRLRAISMRRCSCFKTQYCSETSRNRSGLTRLGNYRLSSRICQAHRKTSNLERPILLRKERVPGMTKVKGYWLLSRYKSLFAEFRPSAENAVANDVKRSLLTASQDEEGNKELQFRTRYRDWNLGKQCAIEGCIGFPRS